MWKLRLPSSVKLAFHDTDTDTDILARIVARMSVSVSASWNSSFTVLDTARSLCSAETDTASQIVAFGTNADVPKVCRTGVSDTVKSNAISSCILLRHRQPVHVEHCGALVWCAQTRHVDLSPYRAVAAAFIATCMQS